MKLNLNFDGTTLLSQWWEQVKTAFDEIETEYNKDVKYKKLGDDEDINDLPDGHYEFTGNLLNNPFGTQGILIQKEAYADTGAVQLAFDGIGANIAMRNRRANENGDVWSGWVTLATEAVTGELADLGTSAKDNLVAAINEVKNAVDNKIGKTEYATTEQSGVIKLRQDSNGNNVSGLVYPTSRADDGIQVATLSSQGIGLVAADSNKPRVLSVIPANSDEVQQLKHPYKPIVPATVETAVKAALAKEPITEDEISSDLKSKINSNVESVNFKYNSPNSNIRTFLPRLNAFRSVGCIGDSLASGECVRTKGSDQPDLYQYSWGQYLSRMTGNKYYNWSEGGLTTQTWLTSQYATECFDGNHLCQAYIIGLGVNDASGSTNPQISLVDFEANYKQIINKIQEVNPTAKIFCLTAPKPLLAGLTGSSTNPADEGYSYDTNRDFNNAIRTVVGNYENNVYLIDLYNDYAMNYYLRSSGIIYRYIRDDHYNAIAYQYCALLIGNAIERIMETNPSDFEKIEFIPYDNGDPHSKVYSKTPTQVGAWIDGKPIWRVAFENKAVSYNVNNPSYYTDGTYSMFIDYSSLSADIIHQNNEVLVIGGQCFAGFEQYSASNNAYGSYVKYVGHIVDNQQFEFDGLTTSANFAAHETIYMTGYIEFVTPKSNIL